MIDAGVRRKALMHVGSVDFAPSVSLPSGVFGQSARLALAVALCGGLAACSAHERGVASSQTPATAQQTAALDASGQQTASSIQTASLDQAGAQVVAGSSVPLPPMRGEAVATSAPVVRTASLATATPAAKVGRSGGGLASWYGDRFHGRPTANGERFDMGGFTAAHRSFPLPSYVRVTNVSNGRSIVVRVNDRGPFHGGRVIDVSRRAADVLGFRSGGVGNVKLDLIGPAPEGRSDDRRLLASYQEFGRPTAAPGQQVAMAPVSDQDLAQESMGYGDRAFAVASAAVSTSAAYVKSSAASVVSTANNAASSATAAVGRALSPKQKAPVVERPTAVAAAQPAGAVPAAYAAPEPALASVPAAIASTKPRVIAPSEPVLASAGPATPVASPAPAVRTASADVSSRISASFDSFDAFAPQLRSSSTR